MLLLLCEQTRCVSVLRVEAKVGGWGGVRGGWMEGGDLRLPGEKEVRDV